MNIPGLSFVAEVAPPYTPIARTAATPSTPRTPGVALAVPTSDAEIRVTLITSLSPDPNQSSAQRRNVESWRDAGCEVMVLQTPAEGFLLDGWPIKVVALPDPLTGMATFKRPLIPISRMMDAARELPPESYALLLNADNRLAAPPPMLRDLAAMTDDGLCYIHRHNVEAGVATREWFGIDGFLFRAGDASLVPESTLCMGRPAFDWMLPWAFQLAGRALYSPRFPISYHKTHALRWGGTDHATCARELGRLTGQAVEATRAGFVQKTIPLDVNPAWPALPPTPPGL